MALLCLLRADPAWSGEDPASAYQQASARVRKEMLELPYPEFALRTVPGQYRNESVVTLASYNSVQAGVSPGSRKKWVAYRERTRQLIAVQDQAAVEYLSETSFNEFTSRNTGYGQLTTRSFLGVRVIKPDGQISEINPDQDEVRRRYNIGQGVRVAIPNLQPGDLLDFYFVTESDGEPANFSTFNYQSSLASRLPVLNSRKEFETGPDFAVEFHNLNGAPAFQTTETGKGRWKLSHFSDSLYRIPKQLGFVMEKRQFPLLQVNIMQGDLAPYTSLTRRQPGTMHADPAQDRFLWDELIALNLMKPFVLRAGGYLVGEKSAAVRGFFDSLAQSGRQLAQDSLAADLYYMFRFDYMFNMAGRMSAKTIANLNTALFDPVLYHYLLSEYFKLHNLKSEVVIASPIDEPAFRDVIDCRDYELMTAVNAGHDILFGANDLYSPAFYTPSRLEGVTDAVAVDTRGTTSRLGHDYVARGMQVPYSEAFQNVREEELALIPDPGCAGLRVARTTKLSGHYKDKIQSHLLTIEDFYNYERSFYHETRTLEAKVLERREPGTIGSELKAALAKARAEQQQYFETEAKNWILPELTELKSPVVHNPGVRHSDQVFQYGSRFRANSLLRAAGNNYMLEIGKLIRKVDGISADQKQRSIDAYLGFANIYRGAYTVRVPEGFTAVGVEALNRSVETDAGSFIVKANLDGSIINVNLELICRDSKYSPQDWSKLAEVLEAAGSWKSSRILFRRSS